MSSRGSSSRVSNSEERPRVFGVPTRCWCGDGIVSLTSHSESNPYRRYLRCGYAAKLKLVNDKHVFKWIDDASIEELETVSNRITRLEDAFSRGMDFQMEMREEMRLEAKFESTQAMKMNLIVVIIASLVMFAILFAANKLI